MYELAELGGPGGKRQLLCERLFFGFRPIRVQHDTTVARVRELLGRFGIFGTQRAALLHMTLLVLCDMPAISNEIERRYASVGDQIAEQPFDPFRVTFERLQRLDGPHEPLVLKPAKAPPSYKRLQNAVRARLALAGLADLPHGVSNAHATILYGNGAVDERIDPMFWDIDELLLIKSWVGLSRHEVVARWPLRGAPDLFQDC